MIAALALPAAAAFAFQSYPVALQAPPSSAVTQTYDAATGIYNIHVDENNFGEDATRPAIRFAALTEPLPEYAKTLAFEYKATKACGEQKFVAYNLMSSGKNVLRITISTRMEASDEWETYRIPIAKYRGNPRLYGDKAGQYQDLIFMDFITGTDVQIRNIRYEDREVPFAEVMVTPLGEVLIEAENFNQSGEDGLTHASRQRQRAQSKYVSPTPGQIPIYAFTSIDYVQQNVSDDFMTNMKATADLMNKKYRDMEAAGFNITEGGAYSGIDYCFLYDGSDGFNGYQANLHDGIENLKMFIRSGVDNSDVVRDAMGSDRLGAYVISDEPHLTGFGGHNVAGVAEKTERVRNIDNSRLLYGNLLHINTIPSDIGAKSYDEYVTEYMDKTGMGVLSYDYYAVRIYGPDIDNDNPATPENCILMPNFYMNMEVISKYSKFYNVPWWGFTMAQSSGRHDNPSSVYHPGESYRYPSPREEAMRVQIFSLLCYGAQGIQYWPYMSCDGRTDGPVNADGSFNPAYHYAKNINTEVKALTWVFLGAEMLRVGHTNAETPPGCLRLTKDIMPDGVTAVTTSGNGMPVSTLQNGKNLFMMAVNPDLFFDQDITVTLENKAKRVLPDGTTTDLAAGQHKFTLGAGGYLIILLDENRTPLDDYRSPAPVFDRYRADATNVAITANPAVSNGYYLPDMGTHSWRNYSLQTPIEETRTITVEQAEENWGAWYAYTVEVPEEMDADIYIGHSVPWSEYGRVVAEGAAPGISYSIEGNPGLDWPKRYAASMTLSLDGETLVPAQDMRPETPAVFDEAGAEFNAILADKSRWISTEGDNNLYFWPKAGGDNDITPRYNEKADYANVHLTAGTHRFVVKSNCYPWNFDNIRITPADNSSVALTGDDTATWLRAYAADGVIAIDTDGAYSVYTPAGAPVASGKGDARIEAAPGIYIVAGANKTVKLIVK